MRSDVSRDFLYHGPVGETVRNLLQVDGVRVQEDGYFVHSGDHKGQPWHTDMDMYGGVFSEFHRSTRGVAVWIALTDIDHMREGGSITVSRGGPRSNCTGKSGHWARRRFPFGPEPDPTCESFVTDNAVTHSFKAGDAIMWHPWMPHKTQASTGDRMTWYARIVEADAVFCHGEYRAKAYGSQASCQHRLRPGQKAHDVCFQQISPLLPEEVAERMKPEWHAPILQPTPIGDLAWKLGGMWDRFRMMARRGLHAPPTLEKLACID